MYIYIYVCKIQIYRQREAKARSSQFSDPSLNIYTHTHTYIHTHTEDKIKVHLDYIPRDDVAYTTGNNHLTDFFTGPTRELCESAINDPLTISSDSVNSFYARVLSSPSTISVTLPATEEGVSKAKAWTDAHVARWLDWMAKAKELDRMKRGLLLSRDNGLRRTWVEGEALFLDAFIGKGKDGQLAKQVAIAISGPQQEAYVGGFS